MPYIQSRRLNRLLQSEIRNMSIECDKVNGINLSQGICDLPLPEILISSTDYAMRKGLNHYTRYDGIDEIREQIASKAMRFNGIEADPKRNIVVTGGATGALYSACFALLNPGDEVILFEPFYGYHEYTLLSLDLVPVFATLSPPMWSIDFDRLDRLVTPKTKAIILNTPSNPTGKVFTMDELEKLGDFCNAKDLIVFTDEIYEYITFDGRKHISPASLPKFKDRTVTVSGFSKTYSITGWRIGYSIANEEITDLIGGASDLIYVCAPAPFQFGVAEAIKELPDSFYASLRKRYEKKRNTICAALSQLGLYPFTPQGAYYVLADVSSLPGGTSKEKAMWILEKTGVGVVPGEAFYHNDGGKNLVRFCFAKDEDVIDQACELLQKIHK